VAYRRILPEGEHILPLCFCLLFLLCDAESRESAWAVSFLSSCPWRIANYCNKDLTACIQAPHHGQTSVISPRITNHLTSRSAVFRGDPLRMLSDITFSLMVITAGRKAYCHMTAMRTNRCRSMACIDRRCQGERRPEGCAGYC
jgi:hypothetical protein